MRIRNADGGEAEACGNATRCVADLLMQETGSRPGRDRDRRRGCSMPRLPATGGSASIWGRRGSTGARSRWPAPWTRCISTLALGRARRSRRRSHGQSACDVLRRRCRGVDLTALGPRLEHHPLFPERANIDFAPILSPDTHPPAGLGARRRHDAGLRHRRLRRAGRGRRRGLTGRRAERRARRRRARDRMAGRRPRADDRAGRDQLHGRARPWRCGGVA